MLGEWMYCILCESNMIAKVWILPKAKNWPAFATGKKWWAEILDEMMKCRVARHVESSFVSPNGERVPNKPASILTFYDFSKVLFSDLIWFNIESPSKSQVWDLSIWWFVRLLCKAFAAFWNFTRTDGLELGIWKISGDLGWTSVLIPDIGWLCGWISGDWPMEITYLTWKWLRSDRSHCNFQLKSVETVNDSFWGTQVSWPRWYLQYIYVNACVW